MHANAKIVRAGNAQDILAAPAAKLRYSAPDLRVVATAEALVQGCGPRSGFDYHYYQTYCW